jgi:hypothetical protein
MESTVDKRGIAVVVNTSSFFCRMIGGKEAIDDLPCAIGDEQTAAPLVSISRVLGPIAYKRRILDHETGPESSCTATFRLIFDQLCCGHYESMIAVVKPPRT